MNVFDAPDIATETYIHIYGAKVLRADPLTRTIELSVVLDNQIVDVTGGAKLFTFLTNFDMEGALL